MWILKRLSEPSSGAGISGIIGGGMMVANGQYEAGGAAILAGLFAILRGEGQGAPR